MYNVLTVTAPTRLATCATRSGQLCNHISATVLCVFQMCHHVYPHVSPRLYNRVTTFAQMCCDVGPTLRPHRTCCVTKSVMLCRLVYPNVSPHIPNCVYVVTHIHSNLSNFVTTSVQMSQYVCHKYFTTIVLLSCNIYPTVSPRRSGSVTTSVQLHHHVCPTVSPHLSNCVYDSLGAPSCIPSCVTVQLCLHVCPTTLAQLCLHVCPTTLAQLCLRS